MTARKGTISVQTADIFPIIKKWLYSEHDIFLRELVSNATDAITKRATLGRTSNVEVPTGKIDVQVNKKEKTIKIIDNGIGMTEAEVEKYIAQLAFSGASEFIEKMKNEEEKGADIIGKFGLGFYSAFMVASKVEVDSLSNVEGSAATNWSCEGDVDYTFSESTRTEVGTEITLFINEENEEFLNDAKLSEVLRRFCDFMPYTINVISDDRKEEENYEPTVINETSPLWKRDPKELKDEDYTTFYRKMFPMDPEPLFWLHLKVDHPFTLEGILFFPKINKKMAFQEGNIRLYQKQVFVSDNVKNIIPEFLSLLKGVIDSPDIPLNVSRSSLQGDPNIRRVSNYVVKKVAESLKKLFNNDREKYEQIWEDTGLFVKYGSISDPKFDEAMRERVIFSNSDNKYVTLTEYRESIPEKYAEKMGDKVLYFEKDKSDHSLRKTLKEEGLHAIETDDHIDPHLMQHTETNKVGENAIQFASIDAEFSNLLETEATNEEDIKVKELFQNILVGEAKEENPSQMEVEIQKVKNTQTPAYFKIDEQMKRFAKMAESMGNGAGAFPLKKTLVINPNNTLIQNALRLHEKGENAPLVEKLCHHVEDLASISSEGLKQEDKEGFVIRTQNLIQELTSSL
jgi:molecular chaperone HtpG